MVVTNPDTQSGTLASGFTYTTPPTENISFVQVNAAVPQTPQTTVAVNYTAAQTASNLNIVVVGWNDSTQVVNSVTDSLNNSYALAVGPTINVAGGISQAIYYAKNIAAAPAGGNTVTVTFSGPAVYPDIRILEYSGADFTDPVDVTATGAGNSKTSSTAAVTTTFANDLLFAANTVSSFTSSPGAGFTDRIVTNPNGDIAEDRLVTATGSYSATASLFATGQWVMQVVGVRVAGNTPPPPDMQPPTAPYNVTAMPGSTFITLSWAASTDNVGVVNYVVERCQGEGCSDFAEIANPVGTMFYDTGLTPSTSYSYVIRAADAAGNISDYSNTASAITLIPDTQPPTAPSSMTATPGSTLMILSWMASTDNVGVASYSVERCQGVSCTDFVEIATPVDATLYDTGLAPTTSYSYRVRAADAVGNVSDYSNTASATTQTNPIITENEQPGTSEWQLGDFFSRPYASDSIGQIKGYASATSVNKGENITLYVTVNPAQTYTIDVYRLGWYQGMGARLMQHIGPLNGITQPTCPTDPTTGLIECNWTPAYGLITGSSWTSGVYLAVLENSQGFYNYIMFVVRDDSRIAALLYQQPVTTYQAFNGYPEPTGKSFYEVNSGGATTITGTTRAAKVSFDRPYATEGFGGSLD